MALIKDRCEAVSRSICRFQVSLHFVVQPPLDRHAQGSLEALNRMHANHNLFTVSDAFIDQCLIQSIFPCMAEYITSIAARWRDKIRTPHRRTVRNDMVVIVILLASWRFVPAPFQLCGIDKRALLWRTNAFYLSNIFAYPSDGRNVTQVVTAVSCTAV